MPSSGVLAPLANISLVLRVIAIGLRAVGLDGVFGIARLHTAGAAEVPHWYGSHSNTMRVASKHGAGDTVIRGNERDESCYGSEKCWELHSKEIEWKSMDDLNETLWCLLVLLR